MTKSVLIIFLMLSAMGHAQGDNIGKLKELAELGRADAAYRLGYLYWHGEGGLPVSPELSVKYLRIAVQMGDRDARYALALSLLELNDSKSVAEGEQELEILAAGGYPGAALVLANRLMLDTRRSRHKALAKKWYIRAAFQGNAIAYYNAGYLSLDPEAGEVNIEVVLDYLKKGYELGSGEAALLLGTIYKDGRGVDADTQLANEWYEHAAILGNADAQYNLSLAYFSGDGFDHDPVASYRWAKKASIQGQRDAESLIGLLCKDSAYYCVAGD